MKRWLKRTLLGVLGASIVLGGLAACSHGGERYGWNRGDADPSKMRARILERASKELRLDDAQRQRLATLADKLREQRAALLGGSNPRADFQALLGGNQFDRVQAQALVEAKTAALRDKSPEVIAAAGDFFDSLRPEQQQQVRDFLARRRGWGNRS